jgi:predicted nucleic acid-binding protein
MIYMDTSVLVALLTVEPMTPQVKCWYAATAEPLVSGDWCLSEFASAIAIKTRTGQLEEAQAQAVTRLFDALLSGGLELVPVNRRAFWEAASLVRHWQSGLRAGDALHLAIAQELGVSKLASIDRRMAENSVRLGFALERI